MAIENIVKTTKIYTEYDAERRAQEIAGNMLSGCIAKLEELEQNTLALMKHNESLRERVKKYEESTTRHLQAIIYYDETFSRLPDEYKAKFKEIAKEDVKEYDLPFKD